MSRQILGTNQPRRQRQRKRHLKIYVRVTCRTSRLFQFVQLVKYSRTILAKNWYRNGVQVETENGKFAVMCSGSPQYPKFSHDTLFFEDGEEMYRKFITHVQRIVLLIKFYRFMTFPFRRRRICFNSLIL